MAASYITSSTNTGAVQTITVDTPAGTQANDLLVIVFSVEKGSQISQTNLVTGGSGTWTRILNTNQGTDYGMQSHYKVLTASETTTYSFDQGTSGKWIVRCILIRGANTSGPINVSGGQSAVTGTANTAPSVTTTGDDCLILAIHSQKVNTTFTPDGTTTERYDSNGNDNTQMMADFTGTTAGATGAKTATAGVSAAWAGQQIAIAPASGGSLVSVPFGFAHGSIQWLTTTALNGTYTVSGLSFQPKALRFYWVGLQSNSPTSASSQAVNSRRGVGFAVSTTSRRCVGTFSQDNIGTSNCGAVAGNTEVVITVDGNGAIDGRLDINSFTADGFTLIVDDVAPANITVFWEAWGGDDITVAEIGDIAEPAATGTQTYTVTGFDPNPEDKIVMFAGCQSTAAVGTGAATDAGLCVGFASCDVAAENIVVIGNADDASGTMDTDGYCFRGDCLGMITIGGATTVDARATLTAFATNSFSLNWTSRATTNRRYIYLAIKGGAWYSSSTTIAGNTLNSTALISNVPFAIEGISLIGRMTVENTAGTATAEDRIGFGSGRSTTSRNSAGVWDIDTLNTSNITTTIQYASVLAFPSSTGTLATAYDINSLSVNTITLITDTAGGVANEWIGYLVFGDARKPRPVSVGHPFII